MKVTTQARTYVRWLIVALIAILGLHFFYVSTGRLLAWSDIIAPIASLFGKGK